MPTDTMPSSDAAAPPSNGASDAPILKGSEIFVRALEEEGVDRVFGHPGGAVIKIYDAMERIQPSYDHVLVRHEQGGTHAAEGYAKATGRVGTMLATSGPGATNTVTGIADAYLDSVPIVVFTGQVPTHLIGNDSFQETDTTGVTRSITKHNFLVRDVNELASTIRQAYHIARTGRPGPVVVDLPKDVQMDEAPFAYPEEPGLDGYSVPGAAAPTQVDRAAAMIEEAEKPLLYVGGGTINADAPEVLTAFARAANLPVTTTLHGLGAFPETDDLALGWLGMHGFYHTNMAVQNADLIMAVGARFDDRVTGDVEEWAPNAKIIHVDIDPSCISKNVYADCALIGDAQTVLQQLRPKVEPKDTSDWLAQIDEWRGECPPYEYESPEEDGIAPESVVGALYEKTQGDAVMVTDVGQHQMWVCQYYKFGRTRSHISSGGLGTMGFGLPAAMGAAFGMREGRNLDIVCVSGDGGFVMNAQELSVAARHGLPLKIAVINNNYLGMVRQWQSLFHEDRFSHTDLKPTNPDFVRLAEAHHCVGLRARSPDEVSDVIDEAWTVDDRPVVMEFQVPKEEMVFPMVPAGAASDDMLTEMFDKEAMAES
ncbi:biosynthetic-type acetolactate synthase large subunit [Salinibacter ruber]|uniref:Acetolactate synthase n=4 Tax=Salinibacter ruber TaxID=146919 RepID=Q2S0N1_SALRD|nr:biosynthetic-type acetolactate synthase large subunit [Salinibacter ruber]ABC45747.1 acetolactate synthase, large subunit, biosynthetic type [Salinibacter ruber DSM 13855]CBH25287.1 Acetolactate synthase [Salinibacter ruber M8]